METENRIVEGDVLASQWGYGMTIVCFYEVLKVSASGKTVTVRELRKRLGPEDPKTGDERAWPVTDGEDRFRNPDMLKRRVKCYGGEPFIAINDYEHAYPMDDADITDGLRQNTYD